MRMEIVVEIAAAESIGAIRLSHSDATESKIIFGINPHPGADEGNYQERRGSIVAPKLDDARAFTTAIAFGGEFASFIVVADIGEFCLPRSGIRV
jgi:hypothetical protein